MIKWFLGILGLLLWTCGLSAEGPQVFRNEFVVYLSEPECPWGSPATRALKPVLYRLNGEYLDETHVQNTSRL